MYFTKSGEQCTEEALRISVKRAIDENKYMVIASNSGGTIGKALELGADASKVVCVTHMVGFKAPGEDEMSAQTRSELATKGIKVLTTTHLLAGVDRAMRLQFGGIYPPEIVANALRMLGQGTKVCVEIAVMALDAGLIPYGEAVVAVGGSKRGADTGLVVTPAHSNQLFELKIHEILAKPLNW